MLHPRQERILRRLAANNYAEVKELAAALDVDASTIRRDLQTLVRIGEVERVHGGVRLPLPSGTQSSPLPASASHLAIATSAKTFLKPGATVVLGAGPVSDRLGQMILDIPDLTVHTNSPRLADFLSRNGVHVYLAGGELKPGDAQTSGASTAAYFETVKADWTFLECDAVHPYAGFTVAAPWHVSAMRSMMAAADRRCVMAESSQFGARHVGFVADISVADLIITDDGLGDGELPAFSGRVVRASSEPLGNWRVNPDHYGL